MTPSTATAIATDACDRPEAPAPPPSSGPTIAEAPVADCDGTMVLHRDGARECLEGDCAGADLPHGPVDVPCEDVFDEDCPRCGPVG